VIIMETLTFEEIRAQTTHAPLQQHYVSSLHGSVYAGETVFLDEEVILTSVLRSKVAAVIRKESPSGFLFNFYVYPERNGIQVPRLPVPRKRTYIGYPTQEVLQTTYVSVLQEERVQGLAYLIDKDNILSGGRLFASGCPICFYGLEWTQA
jgi:hypothetical protein